MCLAEAKPDNPAPMTQIFFFCLSGLASQLKEAVTTRKHSNQLEIKFR